MKRGLWLALLAALLSAGWANADVWTGGGPECLPAVADYDGDGKSDFAQLCSGAMASVSRSSPRVIGERRGRR